MGQTIRMDWSTLTSGRLTTDLGLRQGIDIYKTATQDCDNYIPSPQGPAHKRPGLIGVQQQDTAAVILPFTFSKVQAYALVFCTDGNLRIYLADAPGTSPVATVSHPYTSDQLPDLKYTQSLDTFYIFHGDVETKRLIRGGSHSSWSFGALPFGIDSFPPMYRFADTGGITLTPSAASGNITLTASAALFDSTWVGIWIRLADGYARITAVTNSTSADATVPASASYYAAGASRTDRYNLKYSSGAISDWSEQAVSARRGYARNGVFHQSRLVLGGTRDLPQTVFGSRTNAYYDFNPNFDVIIASGVLTQDDIHDDDAFAYTLGSQQSHVIEGMFSSSSALQIFTREGEWVENSVPIAPTRVAFQQTSDEGIMPNPPPVIQAQGYTLFVNRTGKTAFSYSYSYTNQSFLPQSISLIANRDMLHYPNSGGMIRNMLGSASNLAVFCNGTAGTENYGKIATNTFDPQNRTLGWSRWTSDHFDFIYATTVGLNLFVLMKRRSDNAVYLAYVTPAEADDQKFLDLALTQTMGSPGTSFTGFTRFANTTVAVRADDYYVYENIAVDGSGNFTLPHARTSVIVGYPIPDRLESMPVAPVVNGQLQRGGRITLKGTQVWAQNTPGIYINDRLVRPQAIPEVKLGQNYTVPFNTIYEFESAHHTDGTEPTTVMRSMQGFPCTINGFLVVAQIGRSV